MARASSAGRVVAAAASVVVAAAMFYVQGQEKGRHQARPRCPPPLRRCTRAPGHPPAAGGRRHTVGRKAPPKPNCWRPVRPVAAQDFQVGCPPGGAGAGLAGPTIWAARAISMMFLDITTIGGVRRDALRWHPEGLAIDVMIPNHNSPEGIELGNQIAGFALANAKRWGVLHVIWRQGFYPGIGAPSWTADYGNETANHFDHVHIATDGGVTRPVGRRISSGR